MKLINEEDIKNCKLFCKSLMNSKIEREELYHKFIEYFEIDEDGGVIEIMINGELVSLDDFILYSLINPRRDEIDEYEINYFKIIKESIEENEMIIETEKDASLSISLLVQNDIVKDAKYKIFNNIEISKDKITYFD